jgi:hypothetical protein
VLMPGKLGRFPQLPGISHTLIRNPDVSQNPSDFNYSTGIFSVWPDGTVKHGQALPVSDPDLKGKYVERIVTAKRCKLRLESKQYKTVVYGGKERRDLMDAKIYVYAVEQTLKCGPKTRTAIVRFFDALINANGNFVTRARIDPQNPRRAYDKIRKFIPILATYVIWGSSFGYALSDKAFENATS